jgi:hypothetical protein
MPFTFSDVNYADVMFMGFAMGILMLLLLNTSDDFQIKFQIGEYLTSSR